MAYYNVMSLSEYGHYNVKLAKLISLQVAVYWSEILDIVSHVVKKNTSDKDGYFKLDRDYIFNRTTIPEVDQLNCDSTLINLGVLERDPVDFNLIRVSLEEMAKILVSDEIKIDTKKLKPKPSRSQESLNKKAIQISCLKKCISETDEVLRPKYEDWVESVYANGRFLTKAKIKTFEDTINRFTSDIKVKLDLINIGIQTGYDNCEWVVNSYTSRNRGKKPSAQSQWKIVEQEDSMKLRSDVEF